MSRLLLKDLETEMSQALVLSKIIWKMFRMTSLTPHNLLTGYGVTFYNKKNNT